MNITASRKFYLKFHNYLSSAMYDLIRKLLFYLPPEKAHHLAMDALSAAAHLPGLKQFLQSRYRVNNPELQRQVFGLNFRNPVGLGAGFDKNALYVQQLDMLGFGFTEIGTVTPLAQPGNDKPRLFRLPADKALINRMGFNNDGVKVAAGRLRKWKSDHPSSNLIIGGNIGKNKNTPNEEAWKDYDKCFRELSDTVDYFVVNVSSPNTPGLRELQEKDALRKILSHLQTLNVQLPVSRPILLKIAPDLSLSQLDDVISLALEIKLDGLVATNTTLNRDNLTNESKVLSERAGNGGLSGAPLRQRSTEIVRYLHRQTSGAIPVIASGGIFTGSDAREKLDAGAALIQVWTGFIYQGPGIARDICRSLINR